MSKTKEFLEEQLRFADHFSDKLVFGTVTNDGTLVLSTSKNMDLKTLRQLRNMINDRIKDLKEENLNYAAEL